MLYPSNISKQSDRSVLGPEQTWIKIKATHRYTYHDVLNSNWLCLKQSTIESKLWQMLMAVLMYIWIWVSSLIHMTQRMTDHAVLYVCHLLSLCIGVLFHITVAQQPVALSLVNVRPVTALPPPACRWLEPPSLIAAMWNGASWNRQDGGISGIRGLDVSCIFHNYNSL